MAKRSAREVSRIARREGSTRYVQRLRHQSRGADRHARPMQECAGLRNAEGETGTRSRAAISRGLRIRRQGQVRRVSMHALAAMRALDQALRCPECHKKTGVANTNLASYKHVGTAFRQATPEVITVETHCACPGGPAVHLVSQSMRAPSPERHDASSQSPTRPERTSPADTSGNRQSRGSRSGGPSTRTPRDGAHQPATPSGQAVSKKGRGRA